MKKVAANASYLPDLEASVQELTAKVAELNASLE